MKFLLFSQLQSTTSPKRNGLLGLPCSSSLMQFLPISRLPITQQQYQLPEEQEMGSSKIWCHSQILGMSQAYVAWKHRALEWAVRGTRDSAESQTDVWSCLTGSQVGKTSRNPSENLPEVISYYKTCCLGLIGSLQGKSAPPEKFSTRSIANHS